MKVLLIGADGTLGTALSELLKDRGLVRWTQADVDLTDSGLRKAVVAASPTLVINAAAYTDVDGAEKNGHLAEIINGTAVGEIAMACRDLGVTMVHFSTDYVFNGETDAGYTEDDVPDPRNTYGRTKLLGERLLQQYAPSYLLIRTSRLFGSPATQGGAKQNFIMKMIELSRTKNELKVVDDEIASPTYAADLAQSSVALIDKNVRGVFHRTNDGACTWYAFAEEIFRQLHREISLLPARGTEFPRPAQRPRNSTLRTTKAPPLRRWQAALNAYLATLTV